MQLVNVSYCKNYYVGIFCIIFFTQNLFSQDSLYKSVDKNSLSVEAFGHSRSLFSFNYERIFKIIPQHIYATGRTGIGYSPGISIRSKKHRGTVVTPIVFSFLVGKKKHFAQLSIGYSTSFGEAFIDSTTTTPTIYKKTESAFSMGLGYRYMWSGFVAQLFPLLQWTNNPSSRFSIGFGISMGGTF